MKCISCEIEINPKWKHAIDQNICPFCGENILDETLKELLTSLRHNIDSLLNYQDQLDDFLLSNYSYIKTDSPNLRNYLSKETIKELGKEVNETEFHEKKSKVKVKTEDGQEQEVIVEKVQSEARTNLFHERAQGNIKKEKDDSPNKKSNMSIAERTQHLKEMANKIKEEGAETINENNQTSLITPEMLKKADPEALAEYQAIVDSGSDIVASALSGQATGEDDEIPPAVLAMSSRGSANGGRNEKDLQSLRDMYNKQQGASKRLNSGKGAFSRG